MMHRSEAWCIRYACLCPMNNTSLSTVRVMPEIGIGIKLCFPLYS